MIVVQCDKCKAVNNITQAMELKVGTSDGKATEVIGTHLCDACWKEMEIGVFLHKLRSSGAQVMTPPPTHIAPPSTPVAVDPRLRMKR